MTAIVNKGGKKKWNKKGGKKTREENEEIHNRYTKFMIRKRNSDLLKEISEQKEIHVLVPKLKENPTSEKVDGRLKKKVVPKTAQDRGQKDFEKINPASLIGLPEGADCVGTADGTVDACLLWLASLVDGVLVVVGWVPVVGLLRVIASI